MHPIRRRESSLTCGSSDLSVLRALPFVLLSSKRLVLPSTFFCYVRRSLLNGKNKRRRRVVWSSWEAPSQPNALKEISVLVSSHVWDLFVHLVEGACLRGKKVRKAQIALPWSWSAAKYYCIYLLLLLFVWLSTGWTRWAKNRTSMVILLASQDRMKPLQSMRLSPRWRWISDGFSALP